MQLHPALTGAALAAGFLAFGWAVRRVRQQHVERAAWQQRLRAQDEERRALLSQMHTAQRSAEQSDQAKTRLVAAASHDLRQPAHALALYLAALRETPLQPGQAELVERMAQCTGALDALLSSLLDVSRIDGEALQPRWEVVALAPLLGRLADEWAAAAEARGLRLALHLSPAAQAATTVTDPLLLERVLRNLISNAVRHTRRGGVLLACRLRTPVERAVDGAAAWRIEVWDTGVGIPAPEQERIFEEFVQLAAGRAEGPGAGLGMGLAIARRLSLLLHAPVGLRSRPGQGSVFWIEGLMPAGAAPRAAAAARLAARRLAGLRVAVIDDDPAVRDAMTRLLGQWECTVVAGADAAEVLAACATLPVTAVPALAAVVADLRLAGGRTGPQEARSLLAQLGCTPPVLFITGESSAGAGSQSQTRGSTCLTKPVSPARLRSWLELAAGEAQSMPPAPLASAQTS
jgi:signal transduction histidine kinase